MSAQFDVYYKWLGIPPAEQPPHHYRLLGVPLFENDADVIANAADRAMAHLRTFQSGPFSADSQRLLNEVAAARVCLLNAVKKTAYDQQLRARLQPSMPPSATIGPPQSVAPRVATPVSVARPTAVPQSPVVVPQTVTPAYDFEVDSTNSYRSRRKRSSSSSGSIILLALVLACATLGFFVWRSQLQSTLAHNLSSSSTKLKKPKSISRIEPADPRSPKVKPTTVEQKPRQPQPRPQLRPKTEANPDSLDAPSGPDATGRDDANDDSAVLPTPRDVDLPDGLPFAPKSTSDRKPVPSDEDRKAAMKTIHDLFDKKYTDAKSPEKKFELAQELYQQGRDTKDDLPAKYALYMESRRLAAEACAPQAILDVVVALASEFEVDDVELTVAAFEIAAKSSAGVSQKKLLVDNSLVLIDEAVRREHFDAARRLATIARSAASKVNDSTLVTAAGARTKLLKDQQAAYEAAAKSIEALAAVPDDPEANFLAGRYRALVDRKWDEGLRMLANGSNSAYRKAAELDLSQPSEPEDHANVAKTWVEINDEDPYYLQLCRARAAHWYRLALVGLTGLTRASVEKQFATMCSEDAKAVTRIVVWNEHNGNNHDSGTKSCTLVLFHHGKEVWRKPNTTLLWEANRDMWTEVKVPSIVADLLKVEIASWQSDSGGLTEVEVFAGPMNLGKNGSARSSADRDSRHPASAVIDGVKSSVDANYGFWLLPANSAGWVEILLAPYE